MNLYLMQHGLSKSKEIDAEVSLTNEGARIVETSAKALKKINISFDVIICSPKKRSIQTAQIVAKVFNFPDSKIIETDAVKPRAPAEEALDFISKYERVFIAGHLPSIKEIISFLLSPTYNIEIDVQNGGCTRIDKEKDSYILKWSLIPDILKLMI